MKGDKFWLIIFLVGLSIISLSIIVGIKNFTGQVINDSELIIIDQNISPEQNITPEQNESQILNESLNNETEIITPEIFLTKFTPTNFEIGESQFSLQIQNKKNETINDIFAVITGNGFSTYDIISIESLAPNEKGYILIFGNFNTPGNVTLAIKIRQYTFYQNVTVNSAQSEINENEENKEILKELSSKLYILKENYTYLEEEINNKKDDYDTSGINTNELKGYIRKAEAAIISEDIENAKVNIILANDELLYQKNKLEKAEEASKVKRLKDYLVTFSAIAGAIITLFALFELLKRKSKETVSTVKIIKEKKFSKKPINKKRKK
ncbi:MAG TPA: hypothetical protein P5277_00650 [Candidatus Paceibacterota bacterium]|nr:hypothetical protein [Candidatus Paceibacterota bacterium]